MPHSLPGCLLLSSLSIWCIGLISPPLSAEDQIAMLALVKAGHRATRESIHTFSATVSIEKTHPTKLAYVSGKYWRMFDVIRVQERHPTGGIEDYLLRDSEIRQVGRIAQPRGGQSFVAARKATTDLFCMCDVWTEMLIDLPGPGSFQYPLEQFLEFAKRTPAVRRVNEAGRQYIQVSLLYDGPNGNEMECTLWHDVDMNFLIRRMTVKGSGSATRSESENLQFMEAQPSVYFPTVCRRQQFRRDELVSTDATTLTDVHINEPISSRIFELPQVPRGTIVEDRISRTKYPIDANWRAIGRASPLSDPMGVLAASDGEDAEYTSQSIEEPKRLARLLVPISLLVLGLAVGYRFWRRFSVK